MLYSRTSISLFENINNPYHIWWKLFQFVTYRFSYWSIGNEVYWCWFMCIYGNWNNKMIYHLALIVRGLIQYRKSYCGDKTILRPPYLHDGISYTGKMASLYWTRVQIIPSKVVNIMAVNGIESYVNDYVSFLYDFLGVETQKYGTTRIAEKVGSIRRSIELFTPTRQSPCRLIHRAFAKHQHPKSPYVLPFGKGGYHLLCHFSVK